MDHPTSSTNDYNNSNVAVDGSDTTSHHDAVTQQDESSWSRHVESDDVPTDDDDDEDNWSRQVQTDETLQHMPSSVTGDIATLDEDSMDDASAAALAAAALPRREQPTLREQMVERERQRRVESERARWKRQFAMAAHSEADDEEEHPPHGTDRATSGGGEDRSEGTESAHDDAMAMRETNSVAGTVGEDTVAPLETLEEEHSKMNYPMERFLKEKEDSIQNNREDERKKDVSRDSATSQGVVMERFLKETPVVMVGDQDIRNGEDSATSPSNVQRGVSFDTEHQAAASIPSLHRDFLNMSTVSSSIADASTDRERIHDEIHAPMEIMQSTAGSVANASTTCLPPCEDDQDNTDGILEIPPSAPADATEQVSGQVADELLPSTNPVIVMDEPDSPSGPRVLRLTEAEIQEMAAIDEASRSNAPPSDRDDMSELGELVSDFGGPPHIMDHPNNSQGTPTTAMESASSVANQSGFANQSVDDQLSVDAMGTASVSSHVVASSVGGDASIAGNPPSDIGRDDDEKGHGPRDIVVTNEMIPISPPPVDTHEPTAVLRGDTSLPQLDDTANPNAGTANDALAQFVSDENIVNRTMRPGLFNYRQSQPRESAIAASSRHQYSSSLQNRTVLTPDVEHIDGFDFDKNVHDPPSRSALSVDPTIQNDLWSSGLSPSRPNQTSTNPTSTPSFPGYGTEHPTEHDTKTERFGSSGRHAGPRSLENALDSEARPLLEAVPGEVFTRERHSLGSLTSIRTMDDLHSLAESVFSDLRSDGTSTVQEVSNDAKEYLDSSIWKRAFPERLFALTVTLLFEIPVLLMVSGGSDRLCFLIGRTKYQLLLGFLPLSSAISGNVGLQSSTLTTRAISHGQVKVSNYKSWLFKEIGAALYLGTLD
jgi:hypothetical protein